MPPGTLAAPESQQGQPVRLGLIIFTPGDCQEFEPKTVGECLDLALRPGVSWINVEGLGQPDVLARLGERFHLHPLELEDVLSVPQRPKFEAHGDHYFLVLRMVRLAPEIEEEQVSLFFGSGFVLTVQERPDGDVFGAVRERIRANRGRIRSAGADYLAYSLLDAVVDAMFPALESVGERIEALENQVIGGPDPQVLPKIHVLRRDLLTLRRTIWATRDLLVGLQREESPLIARETGIFLRDCHDHTVEALDLIETYRETAAALMEVYLSAQNQRLNEVMKVLTVMSTVFIPLTFIASIYGMNFERMPELKWLYGYPTVLGVMVAVAGGLIFYFRHRGWW
jgi:magnesium transporter